MASIEKLEAYFVKLKPRERILFLVAGAFIVGAIMDRMILGPILSQMKTKDAEIVSKIETVKRDQRVLSFRDSILEEYSKYSTYLDATGKAQEDIIASLLKKIENLAMQQTITIKNIRPGEVEEKPLFQVYKTSIECEGTLNHMLSFMNLLEQSDSLFEITRYNIASKSKGAEIVKSSMDIARTLITVENVGKEPAEKETG